MNRNIHINDIKSHNQNQQNQNQNKNIILKNSKGSFTVEASIIFSITFLILVALVYILIVMYQFTVLQSAASEAALIGSYYWVNPKAMHQENISSGGSTSLEENIYWRLTDSNSSSKKINITNLLGSRLNSKTSILSSQNSLNTAINNRFIQRDINISVVAKYSLPTGKLLNILGLPGDIQLKAQAISPLDDNAEFIRNMDTVLDIKNSIINKDSKWIGQDSEVGKIIDKILKR